MKKDLDYYLGLPYVIEVVPIADSEGGGFAARLPQIGRFAITGDGDTPEEAIANMEEIKKKRFQEYLRKGVRIPEPTSQKEDYSGRFVARLPKMLHRQLAEAAKENGVSLNQYVVYLLTANLHVDQKEKSAELHKKQPGDVAVKALDRWIMELKEWGEHLQHESQRAFSELRETFLRWQENSDELLKSQDTHLAMQEHFSRELEARTEEFLSRNLDRWLTDKKERLEWQDRSAEMFEGQFRTWL
ncbi:MAG: toxin-antitoxin system HicB family antitoxin, partial [Deltaproteobacteria bacterium]|nr:toxin-antitoxin system HicB family antitoxin [Deltaproteobacteria bacterium]